MAEKKKIRKAIIPAAGYGTRFLPATKAMPKEMLPLVDKPIIQYVVEDAVAAGIEDIIVVTGWHKRSIEDHFDYPFELEKRLEAGDKHEQLDEIRRIAELANFYFVRQKSPLGTGGAILSAQSFVENEPFLVLWGDDFIAAEPSRSQQLVKAFEEQNASAVMASMRMSGDEDYKRYGYALGKEEGNLLKVERLAEKPGPGMVDSDWAVISGFAFGPEMFDALEEAKSRYEKNNTPGELGFNQGVNVLLERERDVYALEIQNGKYHDCGNKLEYMKTAVEFALKHKDLNGEFRKFLKELDI